MKVPTSPGFGPQPYYNGGQQFSNVSSPVSFAPQNGSNNGYSPTVTMANPNHFVNQGYNNYPANATQQQKAAQQQLTYLQQQQAYQQQLQMQQQQQQLQQQQMQQQQMQQQQQLQQQQLHQQQQQQQYYQQQQQQPLTPQSSGTRIIPIQVEGSNGNGFNNAKGPISQSPIVMQR